MAEDLIRYDVLVQEALRGVVRKVVMEAAKVGLPGEHHFFIAFDTKAPGVRISQRLKEKYPEEMTIVLQHQFWELVVHENTFEVGLSFDGIPEKLFVPFTAVKGFFDPAVQFGLQFEPEEPDERGSSVPVMPLDGISANSEAEILDSGIEPAAPVTDNDTSTDTGDAAHPAGADAESGTEEAEPGADVVSLDSFRKKT